MSQGLYRSDFGEHESYAVMRWFSRQQHDVIVTRHQIEYARGVRDMSRGTQLMSVLTLHTLQEVQAHQLQGHRCQADMGIVGTSPQQRGIYNMISRTYRLLWKTIIPSPDFSYIY